MTTATTYVIGILFGIVVVGLIALRATDQFDATFAGVLSTLVMAMAAFLRQQITQAKMEAKMDDVATTTVAVAERLEETTDKKLAAQTAVITQAIDEKVTPSA